MRPGGPLFKIVLLIYILGTTRQHLPAFFVNVSSVNMCFDLPLIESKRYSIINMVQQKNGKWIIEMLRIFLDYLNLIKIYIDIETWKKIKGKAIPFLIRAKNIINRLLYVRGTIRPTDLDAKDYLS